ncbi:MAG: recombination associated protein RdgC [Urechidicola sp.]|jgi:recombination associated protein RdgC
MWFKNLQLYRFTQPVELTAELLAKQLSEHLFEPCGSQELSRAGWVSPLGRHSNELVHESNGYFMVCSKRQDKILPSSVVNDFLEEQVQEIESTESRKVSRKERTSLKEEVIFSLMPKAFPRSSLQFAYISLRDSLLVINASSEKRAEDLIHDLREALGSLPLIPLVAKNLPIDLMTQWVNSGELTDNFELGEECELRDNADVSGVIRCKNQNLSSDEILNHLKTGMHVSKLALSWNERVEFMLDEKMAVKRLRFSDLVQEKADEAEVDDVAGQFDVDFTIMTSELSQFVTALMSALGGETESTTQ